MGKSGLERFERLVNAAAEALMPGTVQIGQVAYDCASSGGRTFRDFDGMGRPVVRRERMLRVRKDLVAAGSLPEIGQVVLWTPEGGSARRLRVEELPDRPQELAWTLRCREE